MFHKFKGIFSLWGSYSPQTVILDRKLLLFSPKECTRKPTLKSALNRKSILDPLLNVYQNTHICTLETKNEKACLFFGMNFRKFSNFFYFRWIFFCHDVEDLELRHFCFYHSHQ